MNHFHSIAVRFYNFWSPFRQFIAHFSQFVISKGTFKPILGPFSFLIPPFFLYFNFQCLRLNEPIEIKRSNSALGPELIKTFLEDIAEKFPTICENHPLKFPIEEPQIPTNQIFNAQKDGDQNGLTSFKGDAGSAKKFRERLLSKLKPASENSEDELSQSPLAKKINKLNDAFSQEIPTFQMSLEKITGKKRKIEDTHEFVSSKFIF